MGGDGERTFTNCKEYWQTSFFNEGHRPVLPDSGGAVWTFSRTEF